MTAAAPAAAGEQEEDREEEVLDMQLRVKLMMAESSGRLDLTDCRLRTLPCAVLDIPGLEDLSLAGNELSSLPDGIGRLTSLKRLGLAGNWLAALPDSIGQLTQLEGLWLHGNLLTDLPQSLSRLTSLKQLSVSGNRLRALPDVFGGMTALEDLAAAGNQLAALPPSIGALPNLRKLSLNGNALTALPDRLAGLPALQELWLQGNRLERLPDTISALTALRELSVADNRLSHLPPSFVTLPSLSKLWLYGNRLAGLPAGLGCSMASLTHCWLEDNAALPPDVVIRLLDEASSQAEGAGLAGAAQTSPPQPPDNNWTLTHPAGLPGAQGNGRRSPAEPSSAPRLKALGLDTRQLQAVPADVIRRAARVLKVSEVLGSGPGCFKRAPSPVTTASLAATGQLPVDKRGRLPQQSVLVVALGSAPGSPNWAGLLGRLYRAAPSDEHRAFDVLYVVDAARQWYGAAATPSSPAVPPMQHPPLSYYLQRLGEAAAGYEHVVMLGDSMGATAALLFAPLATQVLAFCPQVDLRTSCMRPGSPPEALAELKNAVLQALEAVEPPPDPRPGAEAPSGPSGRAGRKVCRVVVLSGTWQHDLDQANLLPSEKVQHRVFSLDSHRLALYLDSQDKLLPLVQGTVLGPLGLGARVVRTSNVL